MTRVNVVSAEVSPRLRLQLVASEPIETGMVIVQSCEQEVQSVRTWRTLQLSQDRHLRNDFLNFVDHSCAPNSLLDVDDLKLVALHPIAVGDAITFFYPGSEVELAHPFECNCGSAECLKHVSGAFYLTPEQMRWALGSGYCTAFIEQQFARLLGN